MATQIVLDRNDSFLVRSGDVLFRISDWGDAIMAGARGYIVVEEATQGEDPRFLDADAEDGMSDDNAGGSIQRIRGYAIIIGLAEEG